MSNYQNMAEYDNKQCRLIKEQLRFDKDVGWWNRLAGEVTVTFDTPWVQRHISSCKRCQRRFAGTGKVLLALSLIRCTPMDVDLLAYANTKAISRLQRLLRQSPKAEVLRLIRPQPSLASRLYQLRSSLANLAACLALTILGRIGLFSSIRGAQQLGTRAMNEYYAKSLGQEVADELYPRS